MNKMQNRSLKQRLARTQFPVGIYGLMLVGLAIYFILMAGKADAKHFLNVLRINAPLGIVAISQTIVMLTGGIDLSVGSVITMTNIIACSVMAGRPELIPITLLSCFGTALLIGLCNGVVVAKIKVPPFLATMAMQIMIQGVYLLYTGGSPGGKIAASFRVLSDGWILGFLPVASLIWFGVWALVSVLLRQTVVGRKLMISGGNPRAGKLSGIPADAYIIAGYMASAAIACVAGLLLSAYVGVASPGIGDSYTLDAIACTVIGGTAFTGGKGSVEGTFAGVMIMIILSTILSMLGVPSAMRQVIQGVIIFLVLFINQHGVRRR